MHRCGHRRLSLSTTHECVEALGVLFCIPFFFVLSNTSRCFSYFLYFCVILIWAGGEGTVATAARDVNMVALAGGGLLCVELAAAIATHQP